MGLHFNGNQAELILLIFLVIVFLQSGVDKLVDWAGNRSWLMGHFEKSPLKNSVPLLLAVITAMELLSGLLALFGTVELLVYDTTTFGFYGALTSCVSLLMLLFGQRMAKDYEGAKTIVIYLVPTVFLLFILQ